MKSDGLKNRMKFQCRSITYPSYLRSRVPIVFFLQKSHKKALCICSITFSMRSSGYFSIRSPIPFIICHLPLYLQVMHNYTAMQKCNQILPAEIHMFYKLFVSYFKATDSGAAPLHPSLQSSLMNLMSKVSS